VTDGAAPIDPVLAKRARIARFVDIGQRVGYGLFGLAIVGFAWGFATEWNDTFTLIVIGSMLVGSVVLAPSIVLGYAVKAADREDREQGRIPPA
jgi:hypothetical protein